MPHPDRPGTGAGSALLEPRIDHEVIGAGLAPDLADDLARRLRFMAWAMVALNLVALGLAFARHLRLGVSVHLGVHALLGIVGLGMAHVLRTRHFRPMVVMRLGLAFEVFVALFIAWVSVPLTWLSGPTPYALWSPVAVWVLIFPMIVPGPLGPTILTAILALGTEPLVAFIHVLSGDAAPLTAGEVLPRLWSLILSLPLAVLLSRFAYGLGQRVSEARIVGSYRLGKRLGAGGMGEVYQASHRHLARRAAVKLIQPRKLVGSAPALQADLRRRFEREAQATALLYSPHTVELYDFGVATDGTFYYVMELLDGMDCDAIVQHDGPQPAERVAFLLRQACRSLAEAHAAGLVHRDIKPANILACRYGGELDFVKVLDFGLVRERDVVVTDSALARQGVLSGTPLFMAPEALLDGRSVDARADLYGLGCVGYWLLTGQLPHAAAGIEGLMAAHFRKQAANPLPDSVPAPFAQLILSCLAHDPADRPHSADALGRAMEAIAFSEPWTEARRAAWWEGKGRGRSRA